MKITDVRAIYPNYRQPLGGWRPYLWQIVVRVETDAGVSGYGYGGGGVAGAAVVNRHLRELLLDEPATALPISNACGTSCTRPRSRTDAAALRSWR